MKYITIILLFICSIGFSQTVPFPTNTTLSKPTTQTLNATGTVTAWNSVVTVGVSTANVTTLPTITAADVGKTITIINVSTGINTQLPPAGAFMGGGVSLANNEAITFFAFDTSTIYAISRKN